MIRRVLLFLALGLAFVAVLVWALNFWGSAAIDDAPPERPPSATQVARGAYLARVGNCMLCHTERGGAAYAGGRPIDTPFGVVYSSNLTPDMETGIGSWSAAHFRRALREGRSRDGRLLYPAFPYPHYTRVVDEDVDALFDYLRSLRPVRQPNRAHRLDWPYSTQAALAVWRALYFRPNMHREEGNRTPEWNRGAYLVRALGHCGACHGTRNALGATSEMMDLSGGVIPMQNWYAPSLSSPTEASLAAWPIQDIVQLLKTGVSPRAVTSGPMAEVVLHSTQHLEASDLKAMAIFLQNLPPTATDVDPREVPRANAAVLERGERVYRDHCAQCHGDRGQGIAQAYPPLAGNRAVTMPATANLVQMVLHGGFPPATQGNPRPFGMPPFAVVLSDAEVAAVLTYVRSAWGNSAAPVSEVTVSRERRNR